MQKRGIGPASVRLVRRRDGSNACRGDGLARIKSIDAVHRQSLVNTAVNKIHGGEPNGKRILEVVHGDARSVVIPVSVHIDPVNMRLCTGA